MCGIAGYIDKTGKYRPEKKLVKKMTDAMIHRGPDAEGQWIDEYIALGHRRLSIIDLEAKSNQPLVSHDGKYVITFNGEIYNYIELKSELVSKGAVFRTDSDTEVVIEAYRAYGEECFNQFNGMWSLALYDMEEQKVILSRDRFGIKPAYTVDNEDVFVFASEIKAILAAFPEENIPNEACIYRYLSQSVNEDTDEQCFYKNIKIFPAAHYMIYDLQTHTREYKSYWEVNEQLFYEKWIQEKNPVKTFRKLFESAVELRLRADVEVGACLSGGLDSSAIVGCASKKFGKKMHTFSSVYTDKECNEESYIRKVNERWDTIPHYIKPDDYEENFTKYIEDLTYHHDQPTGGASLYSQYMVMKEVQGKVKVILDGQGADELFAGYIPYYSYYIDDLLSRNTFRAKCKAIKMLVIIKKEWPDVIGAVSTDTIVRLVGLKNSFLFQNEKKIKDLKIKRSVQMFTDDFMDKVHDNYQKKEIQCSSNLNTRLCNDVLNKSIPALLHNEDGNSMAFSIESRVPFLDYRIVEFAIALDGKYKISNQWTKWIIRKACRDYLPKEVAKRKNKMGFPAPFARWLREGRSRDELKRIIYEFGERNIVPKETIDQLYRAHVDGEADYSDILFRIYNIELWYKMCNKLEKGII
ncbi:asparagine synthase (glutamine-hydrolyzing) [Dorea sp. 5-2]|nr:asparagine synthase (glutamine-hydrolyzing) [Dorea sp. 5-2]